jgi:uncharacterized protein (DUF433 family)
MEDVFLFWQREREMGRAKNEEGRGLEWEETTTIANTINASPMNYRDIITIEPGKRGGKPCVRRMRITVYDVLGWLASGMSHADILDDFPELTETDILACLAFVADRDRCLTSMAGAR